MIPFSAISLSPNRLPEEYEYREMSQSSSSTSASIEGIFERDKFLAENRCVAIMSSRVATSHPNSQLHDIRAAETNWKLICTGWT